MYSDCLHIGGGDEFESLAKCQEAAKKEGGNMINWHSGLCNYKKCEDVEKPHMKMNSRGYDIYALECRKGIFYHHHF